MLVDQALRPFREQVIEYEHLAIVDGEPPREAADLGVCKH
jgi:hypothetical protein